MVEIIPKSPQTSPLLVRALLGVSVAVFVAAFGGFLLLVFLGSRTENRIAELQALLGAEKTEAQTQLEQEVFLAKTRLEDFAGLAGLYKDVSPVFSFLESTVHPQVTFLAMNIDSVSQTVQLRGRAESFLVLDEQFAALQAREELSALSLTNLQLSEQGGVDFRMEIQFPPAFFQ